MEWGSFIGLPAVAKNHPAPELPMYMVHYLKAFDALNGDRINTEASLGGIPMPSKEAYARTYRVNNPQIFCDVISAMDKAFIAACDRMREKRSKTKAKEKL